MRCPNCESKLFLSRQIIGREKQLISVKGNLTNHFETDVVEYVGIDRIECQNCGFEYNLSSPSENDEEIAEFDKWYEKYIDDI